MTLEKNNDNLILEIFDMLNEQGTDGWRPVLELVFNKVMKLERAIELISQP